MKIYTRTGDAGQTGLFGGERVAKDHARVEAYGDVDELNSVLGLAAARLAFEDQREMAAGVHELQADLLTVGAQLATPHPADGGRENAHIPRLAETRIAELERWIDRAEEELAPLRTFILPGGAESAALLHLARTVCRRAERRSVSLSGEVRLDAGLLVYLNRLSDLLFTLARLANRRAGVEDIPWNPNPRSPGN